MDPNATFLFSLVPLILSMLLLAYVIGCSGKEEPAVKHDAGKAVKAKQKDPASEPSITADNPTIDTPPAAEAVAVSAVADGSTNAVADEQSKADEAKVAAPADDVAGTVSGAEVAKDVHVAEAGTAAAAGPSGSGAGVAVAAGAATVAAGAAVASSKDDKAEDTEGNENDESAIQPETVAAAGAAAAVAGAAVAASSDDAEEAADQNGETEPVAESAVAAGAAAETASNAEAEDHNDNENSAEPIDETPVSDDSEIAGTSGSSNDIPDNDIDKKAAAGAAVAGVAAVAASSEKKEKPAPGTIIDGKIVGDDGELYDVIDFESSPEDVVRRATWNKGLRCRRNYGINNIQVAFVKSKVAVYVTDDGAPAAKDEKLVSDGWVVLRYKGSDVTDGKVQAEEIKEASKENLRRMNKAKKNKH